MNAAQPSTSSFSINIDEITEMKQGSPTKGTEELESHENDESANLQVNRVSEENMDHVRYRKFFKAFQENDWKGIYDFITKNPQAVMAKIKVSREETLLHLIVRKWDAPFWLMEKLASIVTPESLELLTDYKGRSVFFTAVCYNEKAAEVLVRKNKDLPNKRNSKGLLPIHEAAVWGKKELIQYLLNVTTIPLDDQNGAAFLRNLISFDLYGIALDVLKKYPKLARERNEDRESILQVLANKPLAFESGSRFGYWQRFIYYWIPVQEKHIRCQQNVYGDIESHGKRSKKDKKFTHLGSIRQQISTAFGSLSQKLQIMLWNALMQLVPTVECVSDTKLMHMQSLEIVRTMCHEGVTWNKEEAEKSLGRPIITAAKTGIREIVQEILKAYFYAFTFTDEKGFELISIAILHRQDKVFSFLCKTNFRKYLRANVNEKCENSLHLAGSLVHPTDVPGAALQMQRELQWFKTVESYFHPSLQQQQNKSDKIPRQVFTQQHNDLVKEGEKWMKDTASSFTIVATLIITVVFAAAFTLPGGNDSSGKPNFLREISFVIFATTDALALFSSTTSLLMFLSILTARYSEEDFLTALPKKLMFGLITIFFSIANMMVAFGATIYIALSHPWKWVIIPIVMLGCIPVSLFVLLQFPLLVEIYVSTYRSSILKALN